MSEHWLVWFNWLPVELDTSTAASTIASQDRVDNVPSTPLPPVVPASQAMQTDGADNAAPIHTAHATPERSLSIAGDSEIPDAQPQIPTPQSSAIMAPEITDKPTVTHYIPDHSNLVSRYADKTQWPDWLKSAVEYLSGVSDKPAWARLVSNFIVLEGLMKFPTDGSVSHRICIR